jgi:hypothetical protein
MRAPSRYLAAGALMGVFALPSVAWGQETRAPKTPQLTLGLHLEATIPEPTMIREALQKVEAATASVSDYVPSRVTWRPVHWLALGARVTAHTTEPDAAVTANIPRVPDFRGMDSQRYATSPSRNQLYGRITCLLRLT